MKKNKKFFECHYELAEEMLETAFECEMSTCFVGDYEDTSELLNSLFVTSCGDCLTIISLDISVPDMDGYSGPYLLTITSDGELYCQKAYWKNGDLYHFEDDICYVTPDYYDDAVEACWNEETDFFEVYIGEKEEKEPKTNDAEFHLIKDENGRVSGFTYDNEDDNTCVHIHCCSCEPRDIGHVIDIYNIMTNALEKWFI